MCVYVGRRFRPKKTIGVRLFFVLMLFIKFQVPGSSGSLVLTQAKGVMDRYGHKSNVLPIFHGIQSKVILTWILNNLLNFRILA